MILNIILGLTLIGLIYETFAFFKLIFSKYTK